LISIFHAVALLTTRKKILFQPIREHLMLMRLIYDLKNVGKYKYSKVIKSSFGDSRSLHTAVDHPLIVSHSPPNTTFPGRHSQQHCATLFIFPLGIKVKEINNCLPFAVRIYVFEASNSWSDIILFFSCAFSWKRFSFHRALLEKYICLRSSDYE
jgi:hypothetical protein